MNNLRWKKVKEELPEEHSKVLYYGKKIGIEVGGYFEGSFRSEFFGLTRIPEKLITHWLYLPNIPNKKGILKIPFCDVRITNNCPEIKLCLEDYCDKHKDGVVVK